ncbi:hypothetical protein K438DRAFT_770405 [Mycena galopus ATCC 62051]|nr:hypothetical protein K438DRAFT_770405 [Mycena galopus ATCC 62051]
MRVPLRLIHLAAFYHAPRSTFPPLTSPYIAGNAAASSRPLPCTPDYLVFLSTSESCTESYFRRLDNRIAERFGIGKGMRITLYVILGVASAIETWFYCFWAWQWWNRRAGQESDEIEA